MRNSADCILPDDERCRLVSIRHERDGQCNGEQHDHDRNPL
jgi:hypothetical protein